MTLSVVTERFDPEQPPTSPRPTLPQFEGEDVHQLKAKLTSTTGLELSDSHHRMDQTIAMVVTGRVVRVDHVVEERTGNLIRVETFKIVEATEIDWDDAGSLLSDE
jgi:hypothetical protein